MVDFERMLRREHKIRPGADNDFQVRNSAGHPGHPAADHPDLHRAAREHRRGQPPGRRHRHHEHHAGVGHRAHPRDRDPEGARRHAQQHPDPVPDRGDGAVASSAAPSASSSGPWRPSRCPASRDGTPTSRSRPSSSPSCSAPRWGSSSASCRRGAPPASTRSWRSGMSRAAAALLAACALARLRAHHVRAPPAGGPSRLGADLSDGPAGARVHPGAERADPARLQQRGQDRADHLPRGTGPPRQHRAAGRGGRPRGPAQAGPRQRDGHRPVRTGGPRGHRQADGLLRRLHARRLRRDAYRRVRHFPRSGRGRRSR